ncbi:MAG: sialidase family protein, partial [Planctomycetota bacterium]|nr:sialidase family protein [Planctomycetota bacterium]
GFVEGTGKGNWLYASRKITGGDFRIHARLRMLKQERSAASFFLDSNFFEFEGARRTLFLNGRIFGGVRLLGSPTNVFKRGEWIEFEVLRTGTDLQFLINGKVITKAEYDGAGFDRIGFSPLRSTMQVSEFSITGNTEELPPPMNRGYTIPLIDLSAQKQRQVLVDREEGQYLGHPTTVLLEDGKTMLCVYPKGHGRGPIVFKRSTDAGLTWSERLPTPKSWATSKEVPTLHRVTDAQGRKRIIMFSGLYPIRMAVTEDDGKTWSELKAIGNYGGIVAMGCLIDLKTGPGHYMAMFHDDGRFLKLKKLRGFHVFRILSADGGLTWSAPESIANHPTAHLCEPGIFRSPDGKQLAVLLRENSRRHNSFVIFSDDEGQTWTEPRELPGSLTGDRHTGQYAPDGRLFISFRDKTHKSPTHGDWVAWVGTYEDIANGREGQYRVRLMDNTKGSDCAYPGVEVLPDGTLVTTTYGHWQKGKAPYIMSVQLKLEELDRMAEGKEK